MEHTTTEGKFSPQDVSGLRAELLESGLDSWQAAELLSSFLAVRGYGISTHGARTAVTRIDAMRCSLACMHQELERLALVM